MKKKQLEELPEILAPNAYVTLSQKEHKTKEYVIFIKAEVFDIPGDKILKVALFDKINILKDRKPRYEVFISKKENQFLTRDGSKWRESMLDKLDYDRRSGYYRYSDKEQLKYADKKSEQIITEYLQGDKKTAYAAVFEFQLAVRERSLYERRLRITERIDQKMELVPDAPKDLEKFINDRVLLHSRYIIYEYSRNVKVGYCTHCKKFVPIDHPAHQKAGKCQVCKSDITFIAKKKSAAIYDKGTGAILQKTKEGFILRYFQAAKHYRKNNLYKPEIFYQETQRIFYNQYFYPTDVFYWDYFRNSSQKRWVEDISQWYQYNDIPTLYSKNLSRILKGSVLQYSAIDILARKEHRFRVEKFIQSAQTKKVLEPMIKVGLTRLALSIADNGRYETWDELHEYKTRLKDILGLTKENIEILKKINGGSEAFRILHIAQKIGKRITPEELEWAVSIKNREIMELLKYTTMHKLKKYVETLRAEERRDYRDYTRWCEDLEYDLKNEFVLFPRSLEKAHDTVLEQHKVFLNKQKAEKLKAESKVIAKMKKELESEYGVEDDHLVIVAPKSAKEIINEGHVLHHCVGTYIERMAAGKTIILFIRKKSAEKKPYYTMEVKDGQLIQCRGKNNCGMTDEVLSFVEKFKKKKLLEKVAS